MATSSAATVSQYLRGDMGKACIRFKSLDDLPLEAVGRIVAAVPATAFVAFCEKARQMRTTRKKK